ncbi:MAG: hypothetical protein OEO79_10730 [Gemmatimonadota bacterium]|nr:hypothetical protein [Gemmatimonadota bacterium]MDH3422871.1 hypothetical protein [Gemmatimonadota bacterium]
MPLTFEERISEDLDALFAGAAFLSGGQEAGTKSLLVEAVSCASSEYHEDVDAGAFTQWMEGILVRAFLAPSSAGAVPAKRAADSSKQSRVRPEDFRSIAWANIVRAAAGLPAQSRAALWLVLLRRWSYQDAASAMDIDLDSLRGLLTYRAAFFEGVVTGTADSGVRETGS